MLKLVCLVFLALQVVNALPSNGGFGQTSKFVKPKFCNGLDCPVFSVLEDVQGKYQKRRYAASKWVSTQTQNIDYDLAKSAMFQKLFKYISGYNDKGMKINMTAPVITRLVPGPGPACESNFIMSFYIHGDNSPTPSDSTVTITELKEQVFYVRSFSGFTRTEDVWINQASILAGFLKPSQYNSTYYYTAGYNGPYTFTNRHNEIWLPALN